MAIAAAVACTLPSSEEFAAGKPADLGLEAGAGDGGKPAVVTDAATDADAEAAAPVCPPSALFCEEFEGDPVLVKWTHTYDDDGLLSSVDGTAGRGLGVNLGARDGTGSLVAYLERSTGLGAKKPFSVSFDVNVSAVKNVGIVDFDCFRFHGPFLSFGLRVANYGTGGVVHWFGDALGGGDALYDEVPVEALPASQWVRITCSVTYPTADPDVRISYDGREVFHQKVPVQAYVGEPYLAAGVTKTERGAPAMTVRFDNLVFTSP